MQNKVELFHVDEKMWKMAKDRAYTLLKTEKLEIGIIEFSPGVRIPRGGYSIHSENDEFAYVISGELVFETDKGSVNVKDGSLLYNRKGTPHATLNVSDKPARVLWILSPPR